MVDYIHFYGTVGAIYKYAAIILPSETNAVISSSHDSVDSDRTRYFSDFSFVTGHVSVIDQEHGNQ